MSHSAQTAARPSERESRKRYVPPELAIELEAENALLRAALARSEGAGVRRDLITQELKHRIGNLLAVVQAVARQTFKDADSANVQDFSSRLVALGAAQKLLIESETRAATIADVVATALAPHCTDGQRATFSGPVLALDGRRAHGLTLALHELATNAAKYGALSIDGGWIEVVWKASDEQLDFLWSEHNGPPTSPPTRQGFGSRLILRNLGLAFGGSVDLSFKSSGVECHLVAPLRNSPSYATDQASPPIA
jgi:two-component sensor histidine kinase